jgi:hypothetical protein
MQNRTVSESKQRLMGILTGISLFLLAVVAMGNVGVLRTMNLAFLAGGPTAEALSLAPGLRLEVLLWLVVVLLDLIISLSLYAYLKAEKPLLSLFAAAFRFLYTAMLAAGVLSLVQALFSRESLSLWQAFEGYWNLSLIFFGFHLVFLGLAFRGYRGFPSWLAWLIFAAGIAYSAQNVMGWIWPQGAGVLSTVQMIIALPLIVAELGLAVWFFLPQKPAEA